MEIVRGDTFSFTVTVKDINSVVFDLTGYSIKFMAKSSLSKDDDSADIKQTGTISTPATGEGSFKLLSTDTDIEPGRYFYDVQISNAGGDVYTVINKAVLIIKDQVLQGV